MALILWSLKCITALEGKHTLNEMSLSHESEVKQYMPDWPFL